MNDQNYRAREAGSYDDSRTRPAPVRRRRFGWLILLLVIVAGGLALWYFRPTGGPQVRGGRFNTTGPMAVGAATVEKGDVPVTVNALGTVTPLAVVTVRTQINGQLTQVAFQEGQLVKQGDFLAQIDPRPYQAALDQAQGALVRDQALLKGAQVNLVRFRTLAAQNSIAKQQADDQDALVHQYEGTVSADQAQVDMAKLNLAYCRVVAPISGRVGLRQVDQGNYVQVSDANGIVVITQIQPISVIFTLPEDELPAVMKQLQAGATLQVTAYDRSGAKKLAEGKLVTVDNQIDTTTGTVKLRAQFDNPDQQLFPNQFVTTQLTVEILKDSIIVPNAAIQRGAPGTFVYLIKPDDTVAVTPVKLGPAAGENVAVQSGLNVGDRVVVDGADKLRDGAKVALRDNNATAPTTPDNGQAGQRRRNNP